MHKNLREVRKLLKGVPGVKKKPQMTAKLCPAGKHKEIARLQSRGVDPRYFTCRTCSFFRENTCPYWKRADGVLRARIALIPTVNLGIDKKLNEALPGRDIILDEDPTDALAPMLSKTQRELDETVELYQRASAALRQEADGRARELVERTLALLKQVRELCQGDQEIRLVRGHELQAERIDVPDKARGAAHRALAEAGQGLMTGRKPVRVSAETLFLDRFIDYATANPERPVALVDRVEGKRKVGGHPVGFVVVLNRRMFLPADSRVAVLDATGDKEHGRALLEREVLAVAGHAAHESRIVQLVDQSFSKSALVDRTGKALDEGVRIIRAILDRERPKRPAIITHLDFEDEIAKALDGRVSKKSIGHFRGHRGRNWLESCDLGIVLGTPRPPYPTIRALAAFLYGATEDELRERPGKIVRFYRGYRIATHGFKGEKLARAHRHYVESELIQAIGRFRYLRLRKKVFVLSNAILDLPGIEVRFSSADGAPAPRNKRKGRKNVDDFKDRLLDVTSRLLHEGAIVNAKTVGEVFDKKELRKVQRYLPEIVEMLHLKRKGNGYVPEDEDHVYV
jgi:hypothetical protein